jgi:hypothetical protein
MQERIEEISERSESVTLEQMLEMREIDMEQSHSSSERNGSD